MEDALVETFSACEIEVLPPQREGSSESAAECLAADGRSPRWTRTVAASAKNDLARNELRSWTLARNFCALQRLWHRQTQKDATMSDLKLGEPIPTGIPGIEPVNREEVHDDAEAIVRPFQEAVPTATVSHFDSPLFDQLLLFPMKLGLSMALASTAMLVSPMLMANRPETAGITQ